MDFRFPDSPVPGNLSPQALSDLPELYIAQLKLDGWRCVISREHNRLDFISRHGKPIPISRRLTCDLATALAQLPEGTLLDCEWLARRPACRDEALWVFDIMQHGELPLWGLSTSERLEALRKVVPAELIPPMAETDYPQFFDSIRSRADAEGIVLKRRDARYIGSFRQCAQNPGWLRCKWRAGEDGQTIVYSQARV